ncbi:sugar phosphate isomerase/epimerase [Paenibacillus pasadenensis]|uniref:sugar phosphate isomerase/epimerase family protein n=1 Tax=Paenibacillus pasadenensis TaxID=217090 RepID=UPI00203F80C3|nr:sugar phosphate isomerase/epimerase family protein [Paenibacillus pasadenensis]MCM3748755.1 sugar phosphate isomerase/epimerase [Paenibacillus pasadenensis]
MNIGILSSSFGIRPLRELALAMGQKGFRTTQVNLKWISDIDSSPGKLSSGLANYVAETFQQQGIRIPSLGCYTNLIHPDAEERRRGIRRVKEQIRFARDFGSSSVATETGTLNLENQFEGHAGNQSEDNWNLLTDIVGELLEEAEKWNVHLALEGFTKNVIDTPERMQRMLEKYPSSHLGIVMDPCNYIDETNMDRQEAVIDDAFERLGEFILLAHAKDYRIDEGTMIQPAAGTGLLNYPHYLQRLLQSKPHVHLYLEHVPEDQMYQALGIVTNHIKNVSATNE